LGQPGRRRPARPAGARGTAKPWRRRLVGVRGPGSAYRCVLQDPAEHATAVHYYRSGSAASRMSPADLERIPLDTAELVHISGITAALSESCLRLLEAILDHPARTRVSFDVNYRPALWAVEQARPVLCE